MFQLLCCIFTVSKTQPVKHAAMKDYQRHLRHFPGNTREQQRGEAVHHRLWTRTLSYCDTTFPLLKYRNSYIPPSDISDSNPPLFFYAVEANEQCLAEAPLCVCVMCLSEELR